MPHQVVVPPAQERGRRGGCIGWTAYTQDGHPDCWVCIAVIRKDYADDVRHHRLFAGIEHACMGCVVLELMRKQHEYEHQGFLGRLQAYYPELQQFYEFGCCIVWSLPALCVAHA